MIGRPCAYLTMLKITRRVGESFLIGDPRSDDCILVTPMLINSGKQIKLWITAPDSMNISRTEHHREVPATELSLPVLRHWEATREL